jgi:hypothetical protein
MMKNRELTPGKAALIYSIALVLVVLCELPRVLPWVEETRWKLASGEVFENFGQVRFRLSKVAGVSNRTDQTSEESRESQPKDTAKEKAQAVGPDASEGSSQTSLPGMKSEEETKSIAAGSGPETEQSDTAPPEAQKPKFKPHKVLLIGDSMIAEGFGPALQRRLRKQGSLEIVRKGQYSTGFVHQDDFNWASVLKEFIRDYEPDLLIIQMGANDSIDILDDSSGKRLYCGNDPWREVYGSRVREFLKVASDRKILSFWVGLPIMGSEKYCSKIRVINSVVEQECAKVPGCVYLDSWTALADSEGRYTAYVKGPEGKNIRIRAKDNVHLTEAGGAILTDYFLREASTRVDFAAGGETGPGGAVQ